jgi:phospholipid-translocating ATPase
MSLLKRRTDDSLDTDEEQDGTIDPELRLRTVRTAASVIAESIRSEQRAERRKMRSTSRFFRSRSDKKKRRTPSLASSDRRKPTAVSGKRRNIYINYPLPVLEVDGQGEPLVRYPRNKVRTTSACAAVLIVPSCSLFPEYTPLTFVPKNLYEQFRRYVTLKPDSVAHCFTCDVTESQIFIF